MDHALLSETELPSLFAMSALNGKIIKKIFIYVKRQQASEATILVTLKQLNSCI